MDINFRFRTENGYQFSALISEWLSKAGHTLLYEILRITSWGLNAQHLFVPSAFLVTLPLTAVFPHNPRIEDEL